MKGQVSIQPVERKKVVMMGMLFAFSAAIVLLGLSFGVFSVVNQVEFTVLAARVPGVVFGVVVAFLGMRYFLAVQKLKREVYRSDSRFSWSNFKKR